MGSSYGDLFEGWEIAVAKKLVAQFLANHPWLKTLEFDDILQECLVHWYFQRGTFQADKGVPIKSYMASILSHKLQSILRSQLSDRRKIDHLTQSLEKHLGEGDLTLGETLPSEGETDMALRLDIQDVMRELTPLQRRICRLLEEGYPVTEIAQALGKPRSTVRDEIKRIRNIFSQRGLKQD